MQIWKILGLTFLAAAMVGCGGSGGSGGSQTLNNSEKAAVSAVAAGALSEFGQGFADDEQPAKSGTSGGRFARAAAVMSKQAQACGDGGTQETTSIDGANVGSPYTADGTIENGSRTVYDQCAESAQDENGNTVATFFSDGVEEDGEADSGRVSYFLAAGPSGDPGNAGENLVLQSSGDGFDSDLALRALVHQCEDCANPQNGGFLESELFIDGSFEFSDDAFQIMLGDSPVDGQRLSVVLQDLGGPTGLDVNGRMAFDEIPSGDCALDVRLRTVDTIVIESSGGEERPVSGTVEVTSPANGGETFTVVFNSDGSVTVNGQTFTEQDLAELEARCDFEE